MHCHKILRCFSLRATRKNFFLIKSTLSNLITILNVLDTDEHFDIFTLLEVSYISKTIKASFVFRFRFSHWKSGLSFSIRPTNSVAPFQSGGHFSSFPKRVLPLIDGLLLRVKGRQTRNPCRFGTLFFILSQLVSNLQTTKKQKKSTDGFSWRQLSWKINLNLGNIGSCNS